MAEFRGGTLIGGNIVWHYGNFDPDSKAEKEHVHVISNVTGLQAALDGKANVSHKHSMGDVTGLNDALNTKADKHDHPYRPNTWKPSWDDVQQKPELALKTHNHDTQYLKRTGGRIGTMGTWGLTTNTQLQVTSKDAGIEISSENDAQRGSRLVFSEVDKSSKAFKNSWAFSRDTSGSGSGFHLRYGSNTDANNNAIVVGFNPAKLAHFYGDILADKNVIIKGNLTVEGTTTIVNSETVTIADNIVLLNSNETGTPTQNAGIEVERGTAHNVSLLWDEGVDEWKVTKGGDLSYELYHGGNHPTWDEIDNKPKLATESHNHTSLENVEYIRFKSQSTDRASISTTIDSTHTYFDFNLTDDLNNDWWRWRFTPSGQPVFNAMVLKPMSNTKADLTVSGKVIADSFQGSSFTGNSATASKLQTKRKITLTGDVTGSVDFDGSGNVSLSTQVGDDSHSHSHVYIPDTRGAKRAPSYYPDRYVSFDFQNRADTEAFGNEWHVVQTIAKWATFNAEHSQEQLAYTGTNIQHRHATSDTTWSEWKKLAYTTDNVASANKLATARNIALSGDVSGSANFDGSGNIVINAAVGNDSHTHDTQYLGKTARAVNAGYITGSRHGISVDINTINPADYSARYDMYDKGAKNGMGGECNNANGVMTFKTHPGTYKAQIGFNSNGKMYFRNTGDNNIYNPWGEIYTSQNKPSLSALGYTGAADANKYVHPDYPETDLDTNNGEVIDKITIENGHIKGITKRSLTPGNIGAVSNSQVNFSTSGKGEIKNKIPYIQGNSVMEIGRYIDFHCAGSTEDYDVRLDCASKDLLNITGGSIAVSSNITAQGNVYANGSAYYGDGKEVIRFSDGWLRINPANKFSEGIYCNSSILRTDREIHIGPGGNKFKATSNGDVTVGNSLASKGNITSDGQLKTGTGRVQLKDKASIQYNDDTESIDFVFA